MRVLWTSLFVGLVALCWRSKLTFVLPRVRLLLKVRPLLLRCWMSRFCPCLIESKGFDLCLVEGPCAFLRSGVYIMKTALFWLSFEVLPGPLSYWGSRFCSAVAVEGQKLKVCLFRYGRSRFGPCFCSRSRISSCAENGQDLALLVQGQD